MPSSLQHQVPPMFRDLIDLKLNMLGVIDKVGGVIDTEERYGYYDPDFDYKIRTDAHNYLLESRL